MKIAVIGNGIVGTCTGAWLQRQGHEVVFIDPLGPGQACSYGNAGSLSPSACLPVGMPGMWKKVPRWLFDPLGPLTVRASYLPVVLPWLVQFLRYGTRSEVVRIATALRALLDPVFDSYAPLVQRAGLETLIRQRGALYVYSSRAAARAWQWGMNLRKSLDVTLLDVDEAALEAMEPDLRGRFRFGLFAPDNGSTPDPEALVKGIFAQCVQDGATVLRAKASGFEVVDHGVRSVRLDNDETVAVDGVVIAAGAWSGALARQVGVRVPLETQRGYHITVHSNNLQLHHTVMAVEYNMMVNPMHAGLRLAGSVEFAGLRAAPDYARARVLLQHGQEMFPHLDTSEVSHWMGHRPCLPDSLPVIGPAPGLENVWCAFGHGHVGMCAGATTGREIAAVISGQRPAIDLQPFSPQRFQ